MTALLIFGVVVVILICALCVLITVQLSQTLSRAILIADRANDRHQEETKDLLNRLMTIRWEDYANLSTTVESDEGGFYSPEEEGDVELEEPGVFPGPITRLRQSLHATEEEEALLREDFPEEDRAS